MRAGNAASGSVVLVDADDNVVHAEGTDVVLYGVRDLVVVVRDGLTLVTTKELGGGSQDADREAACLTFGTANEHARALRRRGARGASSRSR